MTIGEAFKIRFYELLNEKNITIHKFVKDNCIARSTLVNILNGNTKNPSMGILFQVSYGFELTPIEFLNCDVFNQEDLEFL